MKVAVLFRGSSIGSYEHWQFKDKISVNYKNNIDNLKNNLLDKYECDVFFHTWRQKDVDFSEYEQLIADLKPKSYLFDEDIDGTHGPDLGGKVTLNAKRVIEVFNDYRIKNKKDYDLVIMLRFDVYFLQEFDLQEILNTQEIQNKIFVYAMGPNSGKTFVDKNSTKDVGIDDNFIIFSPEVVQDYYDCLNMKEETIATTRSTKFFYPTQHCSLHHLYYLLNDKIKIKNLVDIFGSNYKKSLYGIVKKTEESGALISRCADSKKTKIGDNLFVIHYS